MARCLRSHGVDADVDDVGIAQVAGPKETVVFKFEGKLTADDPRTRCGDYALQSSPGLKLKEGRSTPIDMVSTQLDSYLRL